MSKKLQVGKPAIWRTEDIDIPVVIDSVAGPHNGVVYYYVKGTADDMAGLTGVPETELRQETTILEDAIEQILKFASMLGIQ